MNHSMAKMHIFWLPFAMFDRPSFGANNRGKTLYALITAIILFSALISGLKTCPVCMTVSSAILFAFREKLLKKIT